MKYALLILKPASPVQLPTGLALPTTVLPFFANAADDSSLVHPATFITGAQSESHSNYLTKQA